MMTSPQTAIYHKLAGLFLFIISACIGADRTLYVIVARPTIPLPIRFPASLQVVDTNTSALKKVREIVSVERGVSFVLSNEYERIVVVGSPPIDPTHFDVIRMDDTSQKTSFDVHQEGLYALRWHFISRPTGGPYFAVQVGDFMHKPFRWSSVGTDLATLKNVSSSWNDYQYANLSGFQGWSPPNRDELRVFQFDDGRLTLREGGVVTKTPWFIPRERRFPDSVEILALVNNADLLALGGAGDEPPSPTWDIRVLDKLTGQWNLLPVPGDADEVRGFKGGWLVVTQQDPKRGRHPVDDETRGSRDYTFESHMAEQHLSRPGVLILYNVHTHQQYRLETGQADSEVILVDGAEIFYRVNRTIWRSDLLPNKLGLPNLVAEDPAIVDVHWAFLGSQAPPVSK